MCLSSVVVKVQWLGFFSHLYFVCVCSRARKEALAKAETIVSTTMGDRPLVANDTKALKAFSQLQGDASKVPTSWDA